MIERHMQISNFFKVMVLEAINPKNRTKYCLENLSENVKFAHLIGSLVFKTLVCEIQIEKKLRVINNCLLNPQNIKKLLVSKKVSDLGFGVSGRTAKYSALSVALLK